MNFYEADIIKLQKRIKRIEENPDPTKLRCNKMLYEINLAARKAQLEAWRSGKPFGDRFGVLSQAMGFVPAQVGRAAHDTKDSSKYLEMAREKGLPADNSCDMTYVTFNQRDAGDLPVDALDVCSQASCTPTMLAEVYSMYSGGKKTHVRFFLDRGYEDDERNVKHVEEQIREFIDICETKIPGVKYDEDKLIELQHYEEQVRKYTYETYEMLKHKPAPIANKDIVWLNYGSDLLYPDPKKAVEFARIRRDEVGERLAKGVAGLPGERKRVVWTVTRPFFMDPFKVLEKWNTNVVLLYNGNVRKSVPIPTPAWMKGRTLTPLEKVAFGELRALWSGPGTRWTDNLLWVCKELGADAIINYNMLGCTATLPLSKLVADRAKQELGIPTLQLEGKQWDPNYASEETITAKLDRFAEMFLKD